MCAIAGFIRLTFISDHPQLNHAANSKSTSASFQLLFPLILLSASRRNDGRLKEAWRFVMTHHDRNAEAAGHGVDSA
ncbi:unnamed protein product [Sphenostylis stenocarpa]|uniref:Uncharacterized protein n=1 Tax=Sphenostylis stenocarpa TaxID=92480 RepID=A0AA86SCX7_9FABA|nr:unnamed protein product [Sphenostylis stenocarpa]